MADADNTKYHIPYTNVIVVRRQVLHKNIDYHRQEILWNLLHYPQDNIAIRYTWKQLDIEINKRRTRDPIIQQECDTRVFGPIMQRMLKQSLQCDYIWGNALPLSKAATIVCDDVFGCTSATYNVSFPFECQLGTFCQFLVLIAVSQTILFNCKKTLARERTPIWLRGEALCLALTLLFACPSAN